MHRNIIIAIIAILAQGCMTQQELMENTLVTFSKYPEPTEELRQQYEEVIKHAQAEGRVYPGMYLEYGYILAQLDRKDLARRYYLMEKQTWPVSGPLVDRLLGALKP